MLCEFVSVCPLCFLACVHVCVSLLCLCDVCVCCEHFKFDQCASRSCIYIYIYIYILEFEPEAISVYVYIYINWSLNPKPFMASGRVYPFGKNNMVSNPKKYGYTLRTHGNIRVNPNTPGFILFI